MSFRDTGQKDSGNAISRDSAYLSANDGLLIPACNADKSIVVYDVLSYGAGILGTAADGGGTQLGFINAGQNHFGISMMVPAGQGVYTNAQSGNITITYAIVDGLPASSIRNTVTEGGGATTTTADPGPTTIEFSAATSSVTEANTTHTIAVTRSNTNGTASVNYVTANGAWPNTAFSGTDYTATNGTLNFADGVGSMDISVVILDDATNEDSEEFTVTLSSATSQYGTAALGTSVHTVTILNDDSVHFYWDSWSSEVTVEGDTGTQIHTVTVIRDDGWGTASVDYETVDDTATAGTDYTGISTTTLNFADGSQSETIDVVITGDTTVELDETFKILLTNPQSEHGAATITQTNPHIVTILNDDVATTTTTTAAAAASNACVAQTSGDEYYWNVDSTFTPVVGANATHYSRTQYVNADGSLWLAYNGTATRWKINDGVNEGGSEWYESDNDGTNPWDVTWANAYIGVTEKANATHCYPASTSNFCIAGQGYYTDYEGTWVPYNTYNGKAVWWNQVDNNTGTAMFMWYDSNNSVWKINEYGWEPHENSGYSSNYNTSDGDGTNPWDADWSTAISSQYFDSINSGDC